MEALLLIDIQKDFCKGGTLEVDHSEEIISIANELISLFNNKNKLVIGTKDWHPANHKSFAVNSNGKIGELGQLNGLSQVWWPIHCVENTDGAEFHSELLPIENVIYKGRDVEIDSYSGFFDNGKLHKTELDDLLKKNEIDTVYIMGLATDYCVKYTVLDALDIGYNVYFVSDGSKGVNINPEDTHNAIMEMQEKGAIILSSKNVFI
ncbi:bifunctional nicotinamidase/pyrazinamidase [Fusobacterium sp. PH5-44]|uniref:bifunctional nicotinamidase/pyrazinamidase n=1 Tax=unclassified Fusobacterium TaxID=2648384 RepID=UPI003D21F302